MDIVAVFWIFLLLYGGLMWAIAPRATTGEAFFRAADAAGRPVGAWWLTSSVFISWIFAKSITNAANLGAAHGLVGGLAYATYWLSIPFAGLVIYWLRTREGASSLVEFLTRKHGRLAAMAFTLAILIRLYNEIWSNSSVVGSYFGEAGSWSFRAAAIGFSLVTLAYAMKGGLRASIITDGLQTVLFVFFLGAVLFAVLPNHAPAALAGAGHWTLVGGVDLLLVAGLQVLSYPFHDPVLTDRGFINQEKAMLKAFFVAGIAGFIAILLFSLVGVHADLAGLGGGDNVPAVVGKSLGLATFFFMSVVMISSAGSTLDSTFSSLSKTLTADLSRLRGRTTRPRVRMGWIVMIVFALIGNLPMFAGTDILKATTVSGTMVMGLAPVFLFFRWVKHSPWSFHLSFWCGVVLGVLLATGAVPDAWAIGGGEYAKLLGANLYGLLLCTALFWLPLLQRRVRR
jgi:SSS family solute:Na+ symporter